MVSCCGFVVFHQTDESVLQTGRDLPPFVWLMTKGRDGAFQRGRVVTAHVQRISKSDRLLHSGVLRNCSANFARSGPRTDQVVRPTLEITSSTVPAASNLPLEI